MASNPPKGAKRLVIFHSFPRHNPTKSGKASRFAPFLNIVTSSPAAGSVANCLATDPLLESTSYVVDLILNLNSPISSLQGWKLPIRDLMSLLYHFHSWYAIQASSSWLQFLRPPPITRSRRIMAAHHHPSPREDFLTRLAAEVGFASRKAFSHPRKAGDALPADCGGGTSDRTGAQLMRSALEISLGFVRRREMRTCAYGLNRRALIGPGRQHAPYSGPFRS
jgi:hypothetical protein